MFTIPGWHHLGPGGGYEVANSVPIQVIGDPGFPTVPSSCTQAGAPEDTLQKLLANGILGISPFRQECGPACAGGTGNPGLYYICPAFGRANFAAQERRSVRWQANLVRIAAIPSWHE